MGIQEGEEREKLTEEILETVMTENFPQINIRHQSTDPERSENAKQDKCPQNIHLGISLTNYRKSKIKKKILQDTTTNKHLTDRGTKVRITSDFSETSKPEESGVQYLKC